MRIRAKKKDNRKNDYIIKDMRYEILDIRFKKQETSVKTFRVLSISLIAYVLMLLSSCEKPFPKTENVINQDQFTDVLYDFYLYKNINPSITQAARIDYNEINGYILQKHQISAQQFTESYGYYMLNKPSNEQIVQEIKTKLKEKAPSYIDPKEQPQENPEIK